MKTKTTPTTSHQQLALQIRGQLVPLTDALILGSDNPRTQILKHDVFVREEHAEIAVDIYGRPMLTDLSDGQTLMVVRQPVVLQPGDLFFLGSTPVHVMASSPTPPAGESP
jgi:hypothetical protein